MNQPLSLAGTPAASPLGYYSWAFGQAARDPFYIMVVIYIFFPYFSSVVAWFTNCCGLLTIAHRQHEIGA